MFPARHEPKLAFVKLAIHLVLGGNGRSSNYYSTQGSGYRQFQISSNITFIHINIYYSQKFWLKISLSSRIIKHIESWLKLYFNQTKDSICTKLFIYQFRTYNIRDSVIYLVMHNSKAFHGFRNFHNMIFFGFIHVTAH